MAKLVYAANTSLDNYIEDRQGDFKDWSRPDREVLAFINDLLRPFGTYLYGRRMYAEMLFWETWNVPDREPEEGEDAEDALLMNDFARIWRGADKIVYSRTLPSVSSAKTRMEREFSADAVRRLKEDSTADLAIGGAELAGHALRLGLVDEYHLLLSPVVVGGGKSALPVEEILNLELLDERRFKAGVVYLRYQVKR
jgi:dihydrofolate reductase